MFYELEYFFDIDFFFILWIKMNVLNSFEEMKWKKKLMDKKNVFFILILIDFEFEYLVYIEVFFFYLNVLLFLVYF